MNERFLTSQNKETLAVSNIMKGSSFQYFVNLSVSFQLGIKYWFFSEIMDFHRYHICPTKATIPN